MNQNAKLNFIRLKSPANGATVSQLTKIQREFIDDADSRINAMAKEFDYLNLEEESPNFSKPKGIRFSWNSSLDNVILEISVFDDFRESSLYECRGKSKTLYNFLCDTRYYWRVKAPSGEIKSDIYSYVTACDMPVFLNVPSLLNVRDIGCLKTAKGQRIKPRMLIRGSEMDLHLKLSKRGKTVLLDDFKIKTDLDLRQEAVGVFTSSALGKTVTYKNIPCKSYGEFFEPKWDKSNKEIFDLVSDKDSYPIYMHCWGGADRTGVVAMLIGAILGIDGEDIILEWEFSSLSIFGLRSRNAGRFKAFSKELQKFGSSKKTWQENAICYLRYIGVSNRQLNDIRNIFINN